MRVGCALLAMSCVQEGTISNFQPELSVLPGAIAFGEIVAGTSAEPALLFVGNVGLANLDATLTIEGDDEGVFSLPELDRVVLAPDDAREIPVGFAPLELVTYDAEIVVAWNHDDEPPVHVPLSGIGRVPYAPEIDVAPLLADFGAVDVGSQETAVVTIRNLGDADLVLGTLIQSGAGTFSLASDPSGDVIASSESRAVVVTYAPLTDTGDQGGLTIPSNDADEPAVEVSFAGNGGGAGVYPEAIIDCPGEVALHGAVSVHLDGSASFDPDGGPLTYTWDVTRRPDGADPDVRPEPADAAEADLLVAAAGLWEVTLQVHDDAGVPSVPAKCVIDVVPESDLHVELSWAGPTSDLDLHLAENGAELFAVPGDASWCNAAPDWASLGVLDDDPLLALDDPAGFGPEQITIASPADGSYTVRVHAFDDGDDGAVTATVQVFTYGALGHSASQVLERNEVWDVGAVAFPAGTVAVDSTVWDAGGNRGCP